jgi:hypothetical protein
MRWTDKADSKKPSAGHVEVITIPCPASSKAWSISRRSDSSSRFALDIEPVYLMKCCNYKLTVSVKVSNSVLVPAISVLDTGVGPNLIREGVLPPC